MEHRSDFDPQMDDLLRRPIIAGNADPAGAGSPHPFIAVSAAQGLAFLAQPQHNCDFDAKPSEQTLARKSVGSRPSLETPFATDSHPPHQLGQPSLDLDARALADEATAADEAAAASRLASVRVLLGPQVAAPMGSSQPAAAAVGSDSEGGVGGGGGDDGQQDGVPDQVSCSFCCFGRSRRPRRLRGNGADNSSHSMMSDTPDQPRTGPASSGGMAGMKDKQGTKSMPKSPVTSFGNSRKAASERPEVMSILRGGNGHRDGENVSSTRAETQQFTLVQSPMEPADITSEVSNSRSISDTGGEPLDSARLPEEAAVPKDSSPRAGMPCGDVQRLPQVQHSAQQDMNPGAGEGPAPAHPSLALVSNLSTSAHGSEKAAPAALSNGSVQLHPQADPDPTLPTSEGEDVTAQDAQERSGWLCEPSKEVRGPGSLKDSAEIHARSAARRSRRCVE
jgi:hypothetical protein